MASSLVRGRHVICKVRSRTEAEVVDDGAVFQRDGTIVEVMWTRYAQAFSRTVQSIITLARTVATAGY